MHLKVLFLLLIALLLKCSSCSSFNPADFDFDQIKNEVFLKTNLTNFFTNIKCLSQLASIREGLKNSERWALKGTLCSLSTYSI